MPWGASPNLLLPKGSQKHPALWGAATLNAISPEKLRDFLPEGRRLNNIFSAEFRDSWSQSQSQPCPEAVRAVWCILITWFFQDPTQHLTHVQPVLYHLGNSTSNPTPTRLEGFSTRPVDTMIIHCEGDSLV